MVRPLIVRSCWKKSSLMFSMVTFDCLVWLVRGGRGRGEGGEGEGRREKGEGRGERKKKRKLYRERFGTNFFDLSFDEAFTDRGENEG